MNKSTKLAISLGSISVVALPFAVVSCSSDSGTTKTAELKKGQKIKDAMESLIGNDINKIDHWKLEIVEGTASDSSSGKSFKAGDILETWRDKQPSGDLDAFLSAEVTSDTLKLKVTY